MIIIKWITTLLIAFILLGTTIMELVEMKKFDRELKSGCITIWVVFTLSLISIWG